MSTNEVKSTGYSIHIGTGALSQLNEYLDNKKISSQFILVDENSLQHCLPELMANVPRLAGAEIIEIESGEENKTVQISEQIWKVLANFNADRHALMVNLGGGVISDIGGFVAATYKRGIRSVNVPTTLLAQVDASFGGKCGVDLGNLKNVVGAFSNPEGVYILPSLLRTLSKRHLLCGVAEMIKHALVKDEVYWHDLKTAEIMDLAVLGRLIERSITLKNQVVLEDPMEQGLRKVLNFGHTIGHALESLSIERPEKALMHGEAVAIGMICETWISFKLNKLSEDQMQDITKNIYELFPRFDLSELAHHRLIELMRNDKKNRNGQIRFTLLNGIGSAEVDVPVQADLIVSALDHYRHLEHHPA